MGCHVFNNKLLSCPDEVETFFSPSSLFLSTHFKVFIIGEEEKGRCERAVRITERLIVPKYLGTHLWHTGRTELLWCIRKKRRRTDIRDCMQIIRIGEGAGRVVTLFFVFFFYFYKRKCRMQWYETGRHLMLNLPLINATSITISATLGLYRHHTYNTFLCNWWIHFYLKKM